jgi:ABC-type transport system involved in cytochrome c biogenesis permease component
LNGFAQHLAASLRLHFRNRMALLYGYLFPVIYLGAFWVLYRYEKVPLLHHMGELLTVSVLGGACFGLPTAMVSERERGVWRRYRLTPVGTWAVVLSTVVARYVIVVSAGLLQLAIALGAGMTAPEHPWALALAFSGVTFAFIGLGLVIAMLADSVPAVQALGQCLFLPMLIIGGVAVPLASLPSWAQHVSAFFPGRYAVEALQACVNGGGWSETRFDLLALGLIGAAGCVTGAKLFRWESGQRFRATPGKLWLVPTLAVWAVVGWLAESRGRIAVKPAPAAETNAAPPAPIVAQNPTASGPAPLLTAPSPTAKIAAAPTPAQPWESLTETDISGLDYNVPPDSAVVTPIASADDIPDNDTDKMLAGLEETLPQWAPGNVKDPVQRVLNLMCVAGVPDLVQNPAERFVPIIVMRRLETLYPREKLVRLLTWIALHPDEGTIIEDVSELGLEGVGSGDLVRERVHFYAIKFVARLTGRKAGQM